MQELEGTFRWWAFLDTYRTKCATPDHVLRRAFRPYVAVEHCCLGAPEIGAEPPIPQRPGSLPGGTPLRRAALPASKMKPRLRRGPRRRGASLRRLLPLAATLAALAIGLVGGCELRALGVGFAGPEQAKGYAPAVAPWTDLLAAALLPAGDS